MNVLIDRTERTLKLSQATLTCAQLIVSYYKLNNTGTEDKTTHHFQKSETPLVLYKAFSLYGRFRSNCIIINRFHMVLSVPRLQFVWTVSL